MKLINREKEIFSADFKTPVKICEMPELTEQAVSRLVAEHNAGIELLEIVEQLRRNLSIYNIADYADRLNSIYEKYNEELFLIDRK